MTPEEQACVTLLLEMFWWKDEAHWRYQALRMLRTSRGLDVPTFDDFVAGTIR